MGGAKLFVILIMCFSNLYGQKTTKSVLLDFIEHADMKEYPELQKDSIHSVYIYSQVDTINLAKKYGKAFLGLFDVGKDPSRLSDSLTPIPWTDPTLILNEQIRKKLNRIGIIPVSKDSANWSLNIACGVSYNNQNIVFVKLTALSRDYDITWAIFYDKKWRYKKIYSSFCIS